MLESRFGGKRRRVIVDKRLREHPGHGCCQLRQGGNGIVPIAWTPQARLRLYRVDQVAVMRENHAPQLALCIPIVEP